MVDLFGLSDDEAEALWNGMKSQLGADVEELVTLMGTFVTLVDDGRNAEAGEMLNQLDRGGTAEKRYMPLKMGHAMAIIISATSGIPIRHIHQLADDNFPFPEDLRVYVTLLDENDLGAVEDFWLDLAHRRAGDVLGTILGMLAMLVADAIKVAVMNSDCKDPKCPIHSGRLN